MNTKTLIEILKTRIDACEGNPTERCFLKELREAMFRLYKLEGEPDRQENPENT